jgi:N-methylhydantoinase A
MRYYGQNYELTVDFDSRMQGKDCVDALRNAFNAAHSREYGYCNEKAKVQVVNYRVVAIGRVRKIDLKSYPDGGKDSSAAVVDTRKVFFEESGDFVDTKIYNRELLKTGNIIEGPAVIEQMDSTTVIPPSFTAEIDAYHNIFLTLNA